MDISPPPKSETDSAASAKARRSALLGAVFLMATSAIGPGFITQTTQFTVQIGAAFAFAIVVSILVDIAVQLNVWRVIGVAGRRAHELAAEVLPGAGYLLTGLVVLGGFVFNIGNIAGTGLGLDALAGLDPRIGGALSALLAIAIFLTKSAGVALDRIVIVLGIFMMGLTAYVAIVSGPPVGAALRNVVAPEDVSFEDMALVITTLVGGTVGGYITYAGAHRLLDTGTTGPENVAQISRSSVTGILVTGPLGRGHHLGDRCLVHLGLVPDDEPHQRADPQHAHRGLHRHLHDRLRRHRADAGAATHLRRGLQRPHPAHRLHHHPVGRPAPA
jgi:Mn2+/Fe2+ NRAMP family transporter